MPRGGRCLGLARGCSTGGLWRACRERPKPEGKEEGGAESAPLRVAWRAWSSFWEGSVYGRDSQKWRPVLGPPSSPGEPAGGMSDARP